VALTARLWLTAGARTVSAALLVLGQIMLLVGDAVGWDSVLRAVVPEYNPAQRLGLLAWFAICATAALHPSMRKTYGGSATVHSEHGRFMMLLVFALLGPVVTAVTHLTAREPNFFHSLITPGLASLLAVILVVRMQLVTRVAQRRAAALDQQAAELSTALEEQQVLQHELSRRALHDPLTGLGNRALLHERMLEALDGPAALLLLDLDGFKDVNDTYGHPAGDELLVQVAARLGSVLSTQDTLVRLGGDEFAILICEPDAAWTVAQQTLDVLRVPYNFENRDLYLTTSIGLLESTEPTTPSEALRDADLALYAAKGAGKNQVVRFDPQLRAARLEHSRMTAGLHRALAEQEFALHYQPVVDLSTGAVYAVEALLRWYPPGEDTIPPDAFIPTAEEIGLVVPIGAWVLEQACADATAWHEEHGISVSVNVSARQLRDRSFCETVTRALRQSGLPPHALVLEITETMLVTAANVDADTVIGQLNALRALGVRIAIDDFGTGYSSLSYLRELPVDVLKIDRSFTGSTQDLAFTRAILELSSSLSLQTVAEGVETVDQARQLQLMNCHFAQGYHFSRPVKAGAIDELLAEQPAGVS
jgi:diguanylate cyclase (GGDEF)-like protein